MSLDCLITVKATRSHGSPKTDMTDKVSMFLRDSDHYYRAVFQHLNGVKSKRLPSVRPCPVCDPAEALSGFLENRGRSRFGRVSGGLLKMAIKYKRAFKERVPDRLLRDYVIRSFGTDHRIFFVHSVDVLPLSQVGEALREAVEFEIDSWKMEMRSVLPELSRDARRLMAGHRPKGSRVRDIPFYALRERGVRQAGISEAARLLLLDHPEVSARISESIGLDWSKCGDPEVSKAVILLGALDYARGERELPPGYENHPDPDVRALARHLTVTVVMES